MQGKKGTPLPPSSRERGSTRPSSAGSMKGKGPHKMNPMAHRTGRRPVRNPAPMHPKQYAPKALTDTDAYAPLTACAHHCCTLRPPWSPSTTPLARSGAAVMRSQLPPRAGRPRCGPSWGGGAGCHPGTRAPAGPAAAACPVQRALQRGGSPGLQACAHPFVACAARLSDVGWSVAKAAEAPRQASRGAPTGAAEPGSLPSPPPTHTPPTHAPTIGKTGAQGLQLRPRCSLWRLLGLRPKSCWPGDRWGGSVRAWASGRCGGGSAAGSIGGRGRRARRVASCGLPAGILLILHPPFSCSSGHTCARSRLCHQSAGWGAGRRARGARGPYRSRRKSRRSHLALVGERGAGGMACHGAAERGGGDAAALSERQVQLLHARSRAAGLQGSRLGGAA